jgi:hypoxanthine phosphoribosyltransferase
MKEIVSTLITAEELDKRVASLARQIEADYSCQPVTLVGILKGAVVFMVDLARKLNLPVEFDFMDISSYGNKTESSGIIKINKDLDHPITGKNVILVEDIIDTGRTMGHLIKHLAAQHPDSLKICTLLNKQSRREVPNVNADYTGFEIPDEFVVGYGLDYAQRYRSLPYIGKLSFTDE